VCNVVVESIAWNSAWVSIDNKASMDGTSYNVVLDLNISASTFVSEVAAKGHSCALIDKTVS